MESATEKSPSQQFQQSFIVYLEVCHGPMCCGRVDQAPWRQTACRTFASRSNCDAKRQGNAELNERSHWLPFIFVMVQTTAWDFHFATPSKCPVHNATCNLASPFLQSRRFTRKASIKLPYFSLQPNRDQTIRWSLLFITTHQFPQEHTMALFHRAALFIHCLAWQSSVVSMEMRGHRWSP